MLKDFQKELNRIYRKVDKESNLLWTAKDNLYEFGTRSRKTQASIRKDQKWQKETNASFGYGEITKVSTHPLISL